MPRLKKGDTAPDITLMDIRDNLLSLNTYRGKKVLVSFYRFATCPFCNLRIRHIAKNYDKYCDSFEIISIFESQHATLKRAMEKYDAPFRIAADHNAVSYNAYGLEKSIFGVIKGMVFRMPTLIKSMMMGNIPLHVDSPMTRMPADFLIDENGVIEIAYYGNDEGDHLDIDMLVKNLKG